MIGVIGDLHFKEKLGYADFIPDQRVAEKKEILDFIVTSFKDCDKIVFMGDQLNSKNNTSEVIREFVEFIERFESKEIHMLAGNHCKKADGKTAIDFLKEINNPNWHIYTNEVVNVGNMTFCPYHYKVELGTDDNDKACKKLLDKLIPADILFHHHAVSGTITSAGSTADLFDEIVLPRVKLDKKYKLIVGGHIHTPQSDGNLIVTGSIFNSEIGELGKDIWKIDEKKLTHERIPLPGRKIFNEENPTVESLADIPKGNIVKVVLTKKQTAPKIESIKNKLKKDFDAYILMERYPNERKKIHFEEGTMIDFNIEELLKTYAKQKKMPEKDLLSAWSLIQ